MQTGVKGYPHQRLAPPEFKGPVLAVELPESDDDLRWALGVGTGYGPDIQAYLLRNTLIDFFFIAAYAGFLFYFSKFIAGLKPWRPLPAGMLVLATAAFDVLENVGILYALQHSGGSAIFIATASLLKWSLFNCTLLSIGLMMFRLDEDAAPFDQPLTGIVTLLFLASGFVGLLGWLTPTHFQHGAVLFAPVPLATVLWPFFQPWLGNFARTRVNRLS
jgi:hypothetical protein